MGLKFNPYKIQFMRNIIPNLWFDSEAEEAAKLYASLFENSSVGRITRYTKAGKEVHGQPEGKVMTVEFQLAGQDFLGLNGGPIFKFNPAISFLVACETKEEVDHLWAKLIEGGKALMELDAYPFSERYGWLEDKYGLSWQFMYFGEQPITQKITPTLMYVGEVAGKAEEAMKLYTSVFKDSAMGHAMRYPEGSPDAGRIAHAGFTLAGQQFAAMDSGMKEHQFTFNEAVSLLVRCEDQAEIDFFWEKLSEGGDPAAQQCGWLKDKYGVSWQISPVALEKMLADPDTEKVERVTNSFLKMKKFDIAELERTFESA